MLLVAIQLEIQQNDAKLMIFRLTSGESYPNLMKTSAQQACVCLKEDGYIVWEVSINQTIAQLLCFCPQ